MAKPVTSGLLRKRTPVVTGGSSLRDDELVEGVGDQARGRNRACEGLQTADRRARDKRWEIVGAHHQVGQVPSSRTCCVSHSRAGVTGRRGTVPAVGSVVVAGVAGPRVGDQAARGVPPVPITRP